ncbi:MAG: antibiotic resistance protein VanZ [Candidatus Kapaibacterium sp.]|nr:MAG: antibiotic resistance protein VanZ [Candidatus Kapabacteria bacterium]
MRLLVARLPVLVMSAGIFWVSNQSVTVPQPFSFADKLYHVLAYAVYGWTLLLALRTFPLASRQQVVLALTIGFLFAALDELHQAFIPGRTADLLDWVADAVGIAGAVVLTIVGKERACTK